MKKSIWSILMLLLVFSVQAQGITGTVVDNSGLSIPGANVANADGTITTFTDFDGNFTLIVNAGEPLSFSYIGFVSVTMKATPSMKVVLKEEVNTLNEVVVIGYGTKKLGAITGSVSQIKSEEIIKTPAQSAIQAVQGKAAGVNIVTNDEPGGSPTIRIRGLGTLISGRDPLYIIDGVESGGLNGLSPNEIASIDILKDASSLAIYGQKGSNGVVIITTKKGKPGKVTFSYDAYYGQKFIQKKVKMADTERFTYYNNVAAGSTSYFNSNQPYSTDWLDEITDTGEVASHYISMAGGSDNANYYFGVTNYKEKGILMGSEFERTNINTKNEFRMLDSKLKVNQNLNLAISQSTPKPVSAFTNAYKQAPIVPVRFENGRWGVPLRNPDTGLVDINGSDRFNNVANPVAQLQNAIEENKSIDISGSVAAELQLFKELKFTSSFGATYSTFKAYSYSSDLENYLTANATLDASDFQATFGPNNPYLENRLTQVRNENYLWNWDNYATFNKMFNKHEITVVAGMSRSTTNNFETLRGTRYNVPLQSNYWYLDQSVFENEVNPRAIVGNSHSTPVVSIAYFGRAEYEYDGKYLLTAVIRREGTSTFQESQRWGNFPSISAGWVISNESFMQKVTFVNSLKLRGGYGEIGNANVPNAINNVVFSTGSYGYPFGEGQIINPGTNIRNEVDKFLTWEIMKEVDLGLDFRMFSNKLSGTFDVYDRKSVRLLLPIALPPVVSEGLVTLNTGEVSNKGVELSLRWDGEINSNLKYYLSGNYSHNENKLKNVSNSFFDDYIGGGLGNGEVTKQVLVGEALGTFYVYDVTGYDSDGALTYSDERIAAGSYIPTFTYGLSFGMNYKNVDFSVDAYGVGGNKIYNGKKAQHFGGENIEYDYLNSFWTPSTPNAANPKPYNTTPRASTYFIEDGDFLRINNITIGYTVPILKTPIDRLRVYVTAVNPFVFTKYSGFSPEVTGNNGGDPLGSAGIEVDAYPTNKTFLFGLNVSF